MLLRLNEGLEKEYEKVKSKISPKTFAKKNIIYNGVKYDQSSDFLEIFLVNKLKHQIIGDKILVK